MTTIITIALSFYSLIATLLLVNMTRELNGYKPKVNSTDEHLCKLAQWSVGDTIKYGYLEKIYDGYATIDNKIRVKLFNADKVTVSWYDASELFNDPNYKTENLSLAERLLIQ